MSDNPYDAFVGKAPSTNPYDAFVGKESIPASEVLPRAGASVLKTLTEDVPNAVGAAIDDPIGATKSIGRGALDMGRAAVGLVNPASAPYHVMRALGNKDAAEKFREKSRDYMMSDPGAAWDMAEGAAENYGSWDKIKRSAAERPIATATDVASLAVPAIKGAAAGINTIKAAGRAGALTDATLASKSLIGAGLKAEELAHLTPTQLQSLTEFGVEKGWRNKGIQQEYRRLLHDEAGTNATESMLTQDPAARRLEDKMRNGARGPGAVEEIKATDEARAAAFAEANAKLRAELSGSAAPLDPSKIGEVIGQRTQAANGAARKAVTDLYDKSFDPAALSAAGVDPFVPASTLKGVPDAVRAAFSDAHPQGPFVGTKTLAPNTFEAKRALEEFAKTGALPDVISSEVMSPAAASAASAAGVSWKQTDLMRRYLNTLRESSRMDPTDLGGVRRVLDAFDSQMGKANPLLNEARAAHAERVNTFDPGRNRAGAGVRNIMQAAANTENDGITLYNKLFDGSHIKKGEAVNTVERLQKIFAADPEGMAAVKEGALQRLFHDTKTWEPLSPQKTSTAIEQALKGPQGAAYRALFTPEELSALSRRQALAENVSRGQEWLNKSGTSYGGETEARRRYGITAGGALGASAGHMAGLPHFVGEIVGGGLGAIAQPTLIDPHFTRAARRMGSYKAPMPSALPYALPAADATAMRPEQRAHGGFFRGATR